MFRTVSQVITGVVLGLSSITRRRALIASTVLSTALVTAVLLTFLAMANGMHLTLKGASASDVALLLRTASESEAYSSIPVEQGDRASGLPGIASAPDASGARHALVSPETYLIVGGVVRRTGKKANVAFRGMGPAGLAMRPGVRLTAGRLFTPGSNEVVVGRGLVQRFAGFDLGSTVHIGNSAWRVVGVFDSGGNVYESEMWGDLRPVQHAFGREKSYQAVRVRLAGADSFNEVVNALKNDQTLNLEARTELEYNEAQADKMSLPVLRLGWTLSIIMALGAFVGALNTMDGSVSQRSREIATLRALGFRRFAVFASSLLESLVFSMVGALLGLALTWLFIQGLASSSPGINVTQVVYAYSLSTSSFIQAAICAALIGVLGGLLPARRAAGAPIVAAMKA